MDWTPADTQKLLDRFRQGGQVSDSERQSFPTALHALSQKLEELKREVHLLELGTNLLKSAQSPFRRIPPEILCRILAHVCATEGMVVAPSHRSRRAPPWNIGAVCKHWRDVVYSTPGLWTRLTIQSAELVMYGKRHSGSLPPKFMDSLLAGSLPLFVDIQPVVYVEAGGREARPEFGLRHTMYRQLATLLRRWSGEIMGTLLRECCLSAGVDKNSSLPLPMIDKLSDLRTEIVDTFREMNVTLEMPKLRHVVVGDMENSGTWHEPEDMFEFPPAARWCWDFLGTHASSLRTLEFVDWGRVLEVFSFIAECPSDKYFLANIEQIGFSSWAYGAVLRPRSEQNLREEEVPATLFPRVRHVWMTGKASHVTGYLMRIQAPSIKSLKITVADDEEIVPALSTFLRNSRCHETLQSLYLKGVNPQVTIQMLSQLPNLRELVLPELPLEVESALEAATDLAPKLGRLDIVPKKNGPGGSRPVEPDRLVKLLASRHDGRRVYSFVSYNRTWAFVEGCNVSGFPKDEFVWKAEPVDAFRF
ncbi:hypothetical protein CC1G_12302 [Coprinopsis cinerea okayama7|uniref:F-box domain-containing protein n=1 Tax=Coprinopsis cinerea (strain Okayama-7 / 130 / ATCC MYA-4618 / FGSC 9003) TaxID=240176 RepID=A8NLU1_COPC7|nr:hypothetical protein CC1G_12302 [Coprinopsis cinerea okayama7\|eukprot:XP_001834775.1 hypothetical protein CC1G_12302 [Coprinopsis cinerea okayama7\